MVRRHHGAVRWLWVPCSPQARRAGIGDSIDDARLYLQHELGPRFDARLVDAFLEAGPRMVEFLEERTALRFFLGTTYPDYHPAQPGGLPAGRSICAEPSMRARWEIGCGCCAHRYPN